MATEPVTEAAPAKINLCLHVTGRRTDGYHLLDSLVVFASIGDRVSASRGRGLTLGMSGPEAGSLKPDDDNLVLRAARLMGVTDVALALHKALPVASGIGGGSADAAATLRALSRLTGQPLPTQEQALELGADVPVCLSGQPARMAGIGELLTPLPPLPDLWVVLVNARFPVPTPKVFAGLLSRENPALPELPPQALGTAASFADWLGAATCNDLVPPALAFAPNLSEVQQALADHPDCLLARMSGSGGTHFGLFADAASAATAAAEIRAQRPDWWVQHGSILSASARGS